MSDAPIPPSPSAGTVFKAALERLVPEERAAFLAEVCAGRPALAAAVQVLFDDYHAQCLREQTVPDPTVPKAVLSEGVGSTIGRYKLLQNIGEGGCGVVFMAEQREPVQRRVALKIIRLGMDTEQVVARFEAERQALAMMEHPHIAQVLDAGATPAGRPYFVMELVRGVPITRFCDDQQLDTAARLRLFVQVCQAVQHAHQKGVIHRDLKPSTILVTLHDGVPVPKVIDFGIAKATAGRLTDKTLFTAFEQFVGTPAYMSPEQAEMSNLDVDTRSDVYSLGVLLYELLTGQPPLDPEKLNSEGVDEIRRQIREVEAPRPSTQLATLAGAALTTRANLRGTDAPRLLSGIRGDLDRIVMHCLEKDRRRRYDSASALADDIGRHLRNEPITARPPGNLYLLQKLALRHRAAFVTVSAVSLALVLGFGVALRSYFSERAAHQLAEEQRQRADQQSALARRAQGEADRQRLQLQTALNHTDYLMALNLLGRDKAPEAVAHLVRALRAQPDDRASATLLASVLTQRAWLVPGKPVDTVLPSTSPSFPPPRGSAAGGPRGARGIRPGRGVPPATPLQTVTSPDGKWVLRSLPLEDAVRLYDATTGQPVAEPMRLAGDVSADVFVGDSRHLATTTHGIDADKLQRWQRDETWTFPDNPARVLALAEAGVAAVAIWSADGRMMVTAATDGTARTWEARTGRALSAPMLHDQPVREARFSPDGSRLVTVTQDNALRIWDAASGQPVTPPIMDESRPGNGAGGGPGSRGSPGPGGSGGPGRGPANARNLSLVFSPDGGRILVCVPGRFPRVYDAAIGQPGPTLQRLGAVSSAVYSPDGRRILTAGTNGARLWDAATGASVPEFAGVAESLNTAAFSPDGRLIVTATNTGQAHLWDATTGVSVADTMRQGETNLSAVFSPDGRQILTFAGGPDRAARVWEVATGDPVSALIEPELPANLTGAAPPFSASFSPDGRWVLTAGPGARVWDATTGLPVSGPMAVGAVAFHPDGRRLLTTGTDGAVNVILFANDIGPAWVLDLAEALARCRFDATGSLVFYQGKPIDELERQAGLEKAADQPMVVWARRLLRLAP